MTPHEESLQEGLQRLAREEDATRAQLSDAVAKDGAAGGAPLSTAFGTAKGAAAYRKDEVDELLRRVESMSPSDLRTTHLHTPMTAWSEGYAREDVDRFLGRKARDAVTRARAAETASALPPSQDLDTFSSSLFWQALVGGSAGLILCAAFFLNDHDLLWLLGCALSLCVITWAFTVGRRDKDDSAACLPDGLHLRHRGEETVIPWSSVDFARTEVDMAGKSPTYRLDLHFVDGRIDSPDMLSGGSKADTNDDCAIIGRWRDEYSNSDNSR